MCTGGGCEASELAGGEASELAGGDNGLLTSAATGNAGGDGSRLVGSTIGQMNFLFLMYLAPELV